MKFEDYIVEIKNGNIPIEAPEVYRPKLCEMIDMQGIVNNFKYRNCCTKRGLWTLVYKQWLSELASWIGNRKVLEIMAGAGYIAKGLSEFNVNIEATDNFSWTQAHNEMKLVFPVKKMTATKAIQSIDAEVLLVSWPPYNEKIIDVACKNWGPEKPIIYIGESNGGCTGTEKFWDHFKLIDEMPEIKLEQWEGIHDQIFIGYYD